MVEPVRPGQLTAERLSGPRQCHVVGEIRDSVAPATSVLFVQHDLLGFACKCRAVNWYCLCIYQGSNNPNRSAIIIISSTSVKILTCPEAVVVGAVIVVLLVVIVVVVVVVVVVIVTAGTTAGAHPLDNSLRVVAAKVSLYPGTLPFFRAT